MADRTQSQQTSFREPAEDQRPSTPLNPSESEILNAYIYDTSNFADRLVQGQPADLQEQIAKAAKAAEEFERLFGGEQ